jgi:hypothetical protein
MSTIAAPRTGGRTGDRVERAACRVGRAREALELASIAHAFGTGPL